jgi:hypothetical protein
VSKLSVLSLPLYGTNTRVLRRKVSLTIKTGPGLCGYVDGTVPADMRATRRTDVNVCVVTNGTLICCSGVSECISGESAIVR